MFTTYTPGLNSFVFGMKGMDGLGWGITFGMMALVFFMMEMEKVVRRALRARGADTEDREMGMFDSVPPENPDAMKMPKGASKLNLQELVH